MNKDLARQNRALALNRGRLGDPAFASLIQVAKGELSSIGISSIVPIPRMQLQIDVISTLESDLVAQVGALGATKTWSQVRLHKDFDDWEYPHCAGTCEIARQLGFRHPRVNGDELMVMSTDVVAEDGHARRYAFFARYERDVPSPGSRQAELFEIAKHYWAQRQIPLGICTEQHINRELVNQLRWAFDGFRDLVDPDEEFLTFLGAANPSRPLHDVLKEWRGGKHEGVRQFKAAISTGRVAASTGLRPPTLNQPWFYRVISKARQVQALAQFASALETP